MGKDREGKFHPGKGKPSGINKEEGLGLQHTDPENMDQYNELTDKYTSDADELSPSVPLKNINRNTNKGKTGKSGKKRTDSGKKGSGPANDQGGQTLQQGAGDTDPTPSLFEPEMLPGRLTRERFTEIANFRDGYVVTIYLGRPQNARDNKLNFSNRLKESETILEDRDTGKPHVEAVAGRARELLQNEDFWSRHQAHQLAFFLSKGGLRVMVLDQEVEPRRVVDISFYVTPLVHFLVDEKYFFINVVSKKGCSLYRADRSGINPVPVVIPGEREDVKSIPEKDDAVVRTMEGGYQGGHFRGASEAKADDKTITSIFFEAIDDIFWKEVLHDENVPMLLAGVEYVVSLYRNVSDYKFIYEEYLKGNREQQDAQELYRDAMDVMRPFFDENLRKALEEYGERSATETTSTVLAEIIPAAYYGRVAHLFVQVGEHVWGAFDPDKNRLELDHSPDEGGEDLIDNAVEKTIINGGEVFLMEKDKMPADSKMAAIFRY